MGKQYILQTLDSDNFTKINATDLSLFILLSSKQSLFSTKSLSIIMTQLSRSKRNGNL